MKLRGGEQTRATKNCTPLTRDPGPGPENVGGFKFGDLFAHRQTAKLNVSLIFLRLW